MRTIAYALLLFCALLAAPTSVWAQPVEVTELAIEVRQEAIHRVVDSVVERLQRNGHTAKAELVGAKREASRTFASKHLETGAESMLKDLFKNELASNKLKLVDLKFDFHLHRGYENGFRIKAPSEAIPSARTGFSPPRTTGYPAEVAAIDNRAPHSMHDLRDYLADRFTHAALNRAIAKGYMVELHVGGITEALADLKNRQYQVLGEVRSPKGGYERLLVAQSAQGEVRYVITGTIDGMDRVRHLASLLRFAGPNGQGIPSNRFQIVGDVEAYKNRQFQELKSGLSRIGLEGSTAIVGFRGALKNELFERAIAKRGAENLRDVLGSNPYQGLVDRLTAEIGQASGARKTQLQSLLAEVQSNPKLAEGMNRTPSRVFKHVNVLKSLQVAEKALVALEGKYSGASQTLGSLVRDGKLTLPGNASHKTATISRTVDFGALRAEDVRYTTSSGKVESLRLLNNYYGDTMSGVIRALLQTGHTKLAYFGTAGGTAPGTRVGDIHIPSEVYDWKNERTSGGVRNGFLDYFANHSSNLGERLKLATKLGNVFSPAVETMAWLQDVKNRGYHAVEVEISRITKEVQGHNRDLPAGKRASLHSAVIISDVPGSHQTLGANSGATTATFERMVDHYLQALKINDIHVEAKSETKAPERPLARSDHRARTLEVADKLVPKALKQSSLLRDRLAGMIDHLTLEQLNKIDTSKKLQPKDIPGLSEDQRKLLENEVNNAYTDKVLLERLGLADTILSRAAAELAKKHPNSNFELRIGGGIEKGRFSPNQGLTVEVSDPRLKADLAGALERARAGLQGAPPVQAGTVGADALKMSKRSLLHEARPLVGEFVSRAMETRGIHHKGSKVEYSGRQHDTAAKTSELFSRYETYNVGPNASERELTRFKEKVQNARGIVEMVASTDPRLRGGQGRTYVDAEGKTRVVLPNDRPVKKFALLDELTHLRQIENMRKAVGTAEVQRLFQQAEAGDPRANARLIDWEIKAKRNIRMTLPEGSPERSLLTREIERLRRVQDPYLDARTPNGRINWEKARAMAKTHTAGAGSFLLGLFLKDLAKVVQTGDASVISAFFDGLATTEFWEHYGLFVVGAEVGSTMYQRYLARYVKPAFVSGVLRSNVALATGMALPEIVRGKFEGKTFAINFAGLMLSSAAVRAGIAAINWVKPLGSLSRYQRLSRYLKLARGVPGWIYAGVETAVVLYFAETITPHITNWADKLEKRSEVRRSASGLLEAAASATSLEDPRFREMIDNSGAAYAAWRDRSMAPAMEATARFNERLAQAGREAGNFGAADERVDESTLSPRMRESLARLRDRNQGEVEGQVDEALQRFAREREEALRAAYNGSRREGDYDPVRSAGDVSENRVQAYDDEA
ncbi:MAG TPA: hypothetical protein DEA08_37550, partial [Planctomycetes bacterium]|nr:hypothetical protein [Planctomycetota bacterium]